MREILWQQEKILFMCYGENKMNTMKYVVKITHDDKGVGYTAKTTLQNTIGTPNSPINHPDYIVC